MTKLESENRLRVLAAEGVPGSPKATSDIPVHTMRDREQDVVWFGDVRSPSAETKSPPSIKSTT